MIKNILIAFLFFTSMGSFALTESQSLDALKNKVESFVLNELSTNTEGAVQVSADKLDPRLNLKRCPEEQLVVFNPYQTPMLSTNIMGIKCLEETNHWTLFVPIKITILKTVLVARRGLVKGTHISSEDVYPVEMDAQKLKQGYFTDPQQITGLVCKQNINPDGLLNPYNIELAKLVQRGEQVTITASLDNLSVSMEGVAMNDGVLGSLIRVKNLSSKRIIEAKVSGTKQVQVTL